MKRVLMTAMLLAGAAVAQQTQPAPAPEQRIQKLFVLKYADPRVIQNLLRIFGGSIEPNSEMRALAISATPSQMTAIEEAITRLDVPAAAPKNIELTCYMVVGSQSETGLGGPMPKELDSVVTQLKNSFPFKSYRLMDIMALSARTGQRANTNSSGGSVEAGTNRAPVISSLQLNSISIAADGSTIHIDGMKTNSRMPIPTGNNGFTYTELGLSSDVDIKEGQKVVVGRIGVTNDQALFLVLIAKVVS